MKTSKKLLKNALTLFILFIPLTLFAFVSEKTNWKKDLEKGFSVNTHDEVIAKVRVNEQDFFTLLNQIEDHFQNDFKVKGTEFRINKNWDSKAIQSFSQLTQLNYSTSNSNRANNYSPAITKRFEIMVPGGLGHIPTMTIDSLALAVCHEMGHYLGGAPKFTSQSGNWKSVEGQADYYATSKCLKKLFYNRPENRAAFSQQPAYLKKKIEKICDSYLCARIVAAGYHFAQTVAYVQAENRLPSLDFKDLNSLQYILQDLPGTQCRLDTLVAGAICNVSVGEDFDPVDVSAGACMADGLDPKEAKGARPSCWFYH